MDEEHAESRRRQIIDAAVELFDARGYAATTIDEVAAKAGVAKGSVYNYFENKDKLFQQVVAATLASAEADTAALLEAPLPARQKLEGLVDYWHRRLGHHVKIGRLVLEFMLGAARHQGGEMAATLREVFDAWRQRIAGVLAQGVAGGQFPADLDCARAASLIMGLLDGVEIESILGIGVPVDEAFVAGVKRAILGALAAAGAGDGPSQAGGPNDGS